jgi:NAD(P)H dehydrogenase (quinone)
MSVVVTRNRNSQPSALPVNERALIVYAHPHRDSYSAALKDRAVKSLEQRGYQVDVIDLYAEGFDPRLTRDERIAYHSEQPILCPQVERYTHLVKGATALVFVYPTWWWGLPAILKGWLERVMVPGVGFTKDDVTGKIKPGLSHVHRLVGITTYGSSKRSMWFFNDAGKRTIKRTLWLNTCIKCRVTWMPLHGMDTMSDAGREKFLVDVENRLAAL